MKRYAEYKDSGIEWIGEIPRDWNLGKISHFYNIQLGKMLQPKPLSKGDTLEKYICAVNISDKGLKLDNVKEMWISASEKSSYLLKSGDLLVVEGGDVGLSAILNDINEDYYFQNAIHRVKPNEGVSNKYLLYWLSFLKQCGYIDLICNKATIAHFTKEKFSNAVICLPKFCLQQRIVDYLDQKTAGIDNLIADKQKLINLLKEKRQAIISEAVTKGLDKNAQMKDSGIEWIGEIPEGWEVKKLKYLATLYPKCDTLELESDNLVTFAPMECIKTGKLEIRSVQFSNYNTSYNLFSDDDILLAKVTPCFDNQNIVIANNLVGGIGFGSSELFVFRCFEVRTKFLYYHFQSSEFMDFGKSTMYGVAGLKRVNAEMLKNKYLPIPPLLEQDKVINYIEAQASHINTLIFDITTQIKKLKEYRQSIISEAVTGKMAI